MASVRACPEVATQARAESGGRGIPGSAFAALGHDPLRLSVDISWLSFRPRQRRVPEPSSRSHLRRLAEGLRRPTRKLPPSSVRPGILAERVVVSAYRMVPRLGSAGSVGGVRQMHPGGQAAAQVVKELIGNALAGGCCGGCRRARSPRRGTAPGNERVGGWPRRSSRPTMSRRPRPPLISAEPPYPCGAGFHEEKAAGPHEAGNQGQAPGTWVKQQPCEGAPVPAHVPAS